MIYEVQPERWKELIDNADSLPGFIFRGQPKYEWDLSTGIERLAWGKEEYMGNLDNREFWILTQFMRRAHNLIQRPPEYEELIEWLAILQHHGGPTRLLDFTWSIFVGLFFASDGALGDAALWMIDNIDLVRRHGVIEGKDDTIYHRQRSILMEAKKCIGKETSKCGLLPIEPERLNERMSIQQGLSVMPININETFMKNMKVEYGWDTVEKPKMSFKEFCKDRHIKKFVVAKVRIKRKWTSEMLNLLNAMNINANTLFPGLDGFARSLRIHLLPNERFRLAARLLKGRI